MHVIIKQNNAKGKECDIYNVRSAGITGHAPFINLICADSQIVMSLISGLLIYRQNTNE